MPEICCLILLLHSRQLFLRTNFANLTRSLVAILEEVYSSNLFFNAKIPSLCGMLEYRPTASAVTRTLGDSRMFDQTPCIKDFK